MMRRLVLATLYSERTVVVPNGQIMGVPLVNFSRMRWGQYKTELRLRLEDVGRVEACVEIKFTARSS